MNTSRLVKLRKERKLTQAELAKALNVTQSAIGNCELGKREPDYTTLAQIADFYHVTIDYLLGRSDDSEALSGFYPVKKKKFPVLGKVACGEPIFADEDRETWITASADINADFCLIAQGDSMTGAHIEDGDIVFIKEMAVVENGYIAVVLIGDDLFSLIDSLFSRPCNTEMQHGIKKPQKNSAASFFGTDPFPYLSFLSDL